MAIARALRLLPLCLPCCLSFLLSCCGGNGSSSPPENPVPAIASVSPTAATAGSASFTLTITGSNFLTGSTLMWNGTPQKATFVSSSQLTTTIAATQLAATGTIQLVVSNPTPGGGQASTPFTVSAPAAPAVASEPNTLTVGGSAFTLSVVGSNFVSDSVVQWNGVSQPTTYVDNAHLTAAVPASAITASNVGNLPITVATPAPGGGSSNSVAVLVEYPLPAITSLNPSAAVVGSLAFTLTVNGTNFASGATVSLNSVSRVTQFVSPTQLTASILATDLNGTGGNLGITVQNPNPSAGISNVFSFALQNAAPILSSVTPSNVLAGNPTAITVTGSGFLPGATLQVAGLTLTVSLANSTTFTQLITLPVGTSTLTVTNPSPTVGPSNAVPLDGAAAGPGAQITVTSVDPTGTIVGGGYFGGALSSSGRYFAFRNYLRDTCLGVSTGCTASTTLYRTFANNEDVDATGISSDGRYIASTVWTAPDLTFVDTCTGVSSGCAPTTIQIFPAGVILLQAPVMTPDARYISYLLAVGSGPSGSHIYQPNIYDTCVGAAPGCTSTQIPVPTQGNVESPPPPPMSADGRYLVYANLIGQVFLHDSCLGAAPGCAPADTTMSAGNCYDPSISSDAQYVVYACPQAVYLQATCLNGSSSCSSNPIILDLSTSTDSSPSVSNGGRFVAYELPPSTINNQSINNEMVFVYDSCLGAPAGCTPRTDPVSLDTTGAIPNGSSYLNRMTPDGQYILWTSWASNLAPSAAPGGNNCGNGGNACSYIVKNPLF